MSKFKAVFAGLALAGTFAAAHAAPITVGGITWDPDFKTNVDKDFGAKFDFTQWYTTTSSAGGTIGASSYANALALGAVTSGSWLQGVGEVYRVNGSTTFASTKNLELTYVFGGIKLTDLATGTFDSTNGWFKIFVNSTTPNFDLASFDAAAVADAQSGLLWLEGTVSGVGFNYGTVANGQVSAVLNVTGGAAAGNFDPKTLKYSAGGFFEDNASKFFSEGNGQIKGNTIPEPASLALLGVGLLGVAAARRRAK